MSTAKKPKTSAELNIEAMKLAEQLREVRKAARKAAAEEKAERERIARQKEIDEALSLGRKAREIKIGDVLVVDYLRMTDDERSAFMTEINAASELIAAAKATNFNSGKNVYVYLQELATKRRNSASGN